MTIQDGILGVISGTLMVMQGMKRNNLHYYNDNTVIGVVATVSNNDVDSNITSLWHGGDKALPILVKQDLLKDAKTYTLEFCEYGVLGK